MIKSSEIKTWQEREQYATDDSVIMDSMQEEINEIRAALAEAEKEIQVLMAERDNLESACDRRDVYIATTKGQA